MLKRLKLRLNMPGSFWPQCAIERLIEFFEEFGHFSVRRRVPQNQQVETSIANRVREKFKYFPETSWKFRIFLDNSSLTKFPDFFLFSRCVATLFADLRVDCDKLHCCEWKILKIYGITHMLLDFLLDISFFQQGRRFLFIRRRISRICM